MAGYPLIPVSEEIVESARRQAEQEGTSTEDVLAAWMHSGMQRHVTGALMAEDKRAPAADPLGEAETREMADLFNRHWDRDLTDEEQERLDDLVYWYRRWLTAETRAVTDWLALGGVRGLGSPVGELVTVRSTMLYGVGYDKENQVLDVVFNSGGVYRYFDVPPHIFEGLLTAPSVGRYMWDHVLGVYPVARLDGKRSSRRAFQRQQRSLNRAA